MLHPGGFLPFLWHNRDYSLITSLLKYTDVDLVGKNHQIISGLMPDSFYLLSAYELV
jgi:hypothetical protein